MESIAFENESGSLKDSFEGNVSRVSEPRREEQGDSVGEIARRVVKK